MSNIDIKFEGICEGCPYADLELEDTTGFFDSEECTEYQIVCSHQHICKSWERKLNDLKDNKT